MDKAQQSLLSLLANRSQQGLLRQLANTNHLIDFASNDYFGFSQYSELIDSVNKHYLQLTHKREGATGSRLITGNSQFYEELEQQIAIYHHAEAGLIYNSGYDANVGLFSAVLQPDDLVLFDELVHASIRDGINLGRAKSIAFQHNDLQQLKELMQQGTVGNIYVATESLFSMDGDLAPLAEMVSLCQQYGANLIVDEAHATGFFGTKGEGRIVELGLENNCFARVHTFSKVLGGHGAIVLGSNLLRDFLINFSRSFIYTTALPLHNLLWIKQAYNLLPYQKEKVVSIFALRELLNNNITANEQIELKLGDGPILALIVPGNDNARLLAAKLESTGIYAKAILYPTVPRGKERIRICLHSFNTEQQVLTFARVINDHQL